MQELQVLGFDYSATVDSFLAREGELQEQLEQRAEQIGHLKELVSAYKKEISAMTAHINDARALKELQWKNIIEYDQVKNKQRTRLGRTIKEEAAHCKELISALCSQLQEKEAGLGQSLQEYEGLERDKNCLENELNQLRN